MGLLTKEVEVVLGGKNIQHFKNLGYEIPKIYKYRKWVTPKNTKILAKVEDLKKGSTCLVEVECDECLKHYAIRYYDYLKCNHNGKVYCNHCNSKVFCSGSNAYNYNPNRKEDERFRDSRDYKMFVRKVLARDNYICQCCGEKSKSGLEVHHLNGYSWFIEGRIDETNAISLCVDCHSNFHSIYGNKYNTKEQYEEWLGKNIELLKYDGEIVSTRKIYCIDNNTIYDSAEDICKALNIYGKTQIYNVCNQARQHVAEGYHFVWYDKYIEMTQQDIIDYVYKCDNPIEYRKIICMETMEIFDKVSDVCLKYGDAKNVPNIIRACKEMRTALTDNNGNKLHWMYYDEYLEKVKNSEEIVYHKNNNIRDVICITTGQVFNQIKEGGKYYNVATPSISACCKGKIKSCGKLTDGTKLVWMYYEDFLKLPIKEQNEILGRNKDSSNDESFID